jgi:non-specific serine/threonine protein kinase/serine/threonine-protein kinase
MTPERWQRVEALFHLALEREPAARAAFVAESAAGDEALRDEVLQLIAADEKSGSFLAFEVPAGRRIGPYRVLGEVGHGGMGAVYRAARDDDQYRKQVAIKLVRGFTSDFALERFRAERQILANLEHPNIARLIDGGTTEEGWPWFAMELVDGQPLDRYCAANALSTRERLELFRSVCSAVQYAHQRLVVHRDLKPSNILVSAEGVPKLLDFGIAKFLSPDAAAGATLTGIPLMTPDYASPEQVKGEPVATASDVYSLGMLLYELLARTPAYRIQTRSPEEIARVVCQTQPQRPSAVAPREVARELAGDLDTIALKALRKEPARRYASVQDLSEDIRRHLEGLPVLARRDTLGYRAGKFVRRNKALAVAGVLVASSLVGGLLATLRQARIAEGNRARADRRFAEVRKLAHNVLFKYHDGIVQLPGSTAVREQLVSDALEYLDTLSRESEGDPSLLRELAEAYTKLAEVQGGTNAGSLGSAEASLKSRRKALAIREEIARLRPDAIEDRAGLAKEYQDVAMAIANHGGDRAGALELSRKGLAIFQALAQARPGDIDQLNSLAGATWKMASVSASAGDTDAAIDGFRKAAALYEQVSAARPGDLRGWRNSALSYKYLSSLLKNRGDNAGALEVARKALALDERRSAASPVDASARLDLSFSQMVVGNCLLENGDATAALALYEAALQLRRGVAQADPRNAYARRVVGIGYSNVGEALTALGRVGEAVEANRKYAASAEASLAADPDDATLRTEAVKSQRALGESLMKLASRPAEWKEARSWLQRSAKGWDELKASGSLPPEAQDEPAKVAEDLARCEAALAKADSRR